MKRCFWLLICLLMGACTTGESATSTPIAQVTTITPSVTPTLLPTGTPTTELVSLDTPTTIAVTATITPTHTPEPTQTPEPISPPTGRIYFIWDPQELGTSGLGNPIQNLYLATPNETTTTWNIETIFEGLIGWPAAVLSPDKTQMVLTPLEDKNQDGSVSDAGYDRGFDAPNLYLYDLIDEEMVPITTNFPEIREREIYWLPDGQTFLLGQYHTISLVSPVDHIRQIGSSFSPYIEGIILSPNAQTLVVNLESNEILGLDIQTEEMLFAFEEIGGKWANMSWSSNSRWLALHQISNQELFLIDGETYALKSLSLIGSIRLIAWSPDNDTLAVYEYTDTYSRLLLVNPNDLTIEPLVEIPSEATLSYLGWSPDGTQILYLLKQDLMGSLVTMDLNSRGEQTIWHSEVVGRFNLLGWSPNDEWLLLFTGQGSFYGRGDHAAVYILHHEGHMMYELIKTSGFSDPYAFFWLP